MNSFQLNGERDGSLYQQQNEHRGTNLSRKEKKDVPVGICIRKLYLYLFPFSLLNFAIFTIKFCSYNLVLQLWLVKI